MHVASQQIMFAASSCLCAAIGSVHDVRERRIPNALTGPAMLTGLLVHLFVGGWKGLADAAMAGLIAGAIFLVFFLAGGMGAGDVKLMAAVGCFVGLPPLASVMLCTVFAGALFAVLVSLCRGQLGGTLRNLVSLLLHHGRYGITPHPDLNLDNPHTIRLPFALPILTGCVASALLLHAPEAIR